MRISVILICFLLVLIYSMNLLTFLPITANADTVFFDNTFCQDVGDLKSKLSNYNSMMDKGDYSFLQDEKLDIVAPEYKFDYSELTFLLNKRFEYLKTESTKATIDKMTVTGNDKKINLRLECAVIVNTKAFFARLLKIKKEKMTIFADLEASIIDGHIVIGTPSISSNDVTIKKEFVGIASAYVFKNNSGLANVQKMVEECLNRLGSPQKFTDSGIEYSNKNRKVAE